MTNSVVGTSENKYANIPFCVRWLTQDDKDDPECATVLLELEKIDDECDSKGLAFVKINNPEEAKEYGIDDIPALVYFEKGIPSLYEGKSHLIFFLQNKLTSQHNQIVSLYENNLPAKGDLSSEEQVLEWLSHQLESDEIEDVTDEMMDMLIDRSEHLAVLFCNLTENKIMIIK